MRKNLQRSFFFFLSHTAQPMTSAMKVQCPNHWTTRKFPRMPPLTVTSYNTLSKLLDFSIPQVLHL